jgi:hypothetical protein
MRLTIVAAVLSVMLCVANAEAQQLAKAVGDDSFIQTPSIPFGSRIQRTMHLLATSTPEHRHRVRILFYGQSITGGWTDIVLKDLHARFPNADIVCENRAIGGFTAAWLSETAEADLYPFYPDLLFIQDYDALNPAMERMYAAVHDRTTAEVLAFTHHIDYCGDRTSYKNLDAESAKIRELAEKYGFETVDVRASWRKYLEVKHLDRRQLLGDGVIHLNKDGQALMAKIALPHLRYIASQPAAGQDRVRYYGASGARLSGSMNDAKGAVLQQPLRIEFEGNRVDVVAMPTTGKLGTAKILIDGQKPSALPGVHAATRSNACPGNWFPALRRVELGGNAVAEKWDLVITKINDQCAQFDYEVHGSITGADGKGNNKQKFVSDSGRLVIDPAWFTLGSSYQIFKKSIPAGFRITWKVVENFVNDWKPQPIKDQTKEDLYTLAQGFSNGRHVLEIIPNGDGAVPVNYVVVYQPGPALSR